jgi:hypothetical protein
MLNLPPEASDIHSAIPPQEWLAMMRGESVGQPHHKRKSEEYGCMINRDFTVGANKIESIQYKKGMQGRLLEESINNNGTKVSNIFIQGVTEGNNFYNKWVPR